MDGFLPLSGRIPTIYGRIPTRYVDGFLPLSGRIPTMYGRIPTMLNLMSFIC